MGKMTKLVKLNSFPKQRANFAIYEKGIITIGTQNEVQLIANYQNQKFKHQFHPTIKLSQLSSDLQSLLNVSRVEFYQQKTIQFFEDTKFEQIDQDMMFIMIDGEKVIKITNIQSILEFNHLFAHIIKN